MRECEPSARKAGNFQQVPTSNTVSSLSKKQTRDKDGSISLQERNFSFVGAFLIVVSLSAYLIDTLTDILVSIKYFHSGDLWWGILTLSFILIPSIVIQVFSFRWYSADGNANGWRTWLLHIFHFQPLERYLHALTAGIDARRTQDEADIEVYLYQQNDVCMLRLFEAFLESAPQLTLQLYIMVATQAAGWLTALSASISLLAIGWAVAAYSHALRCAYRNNYAISWAGLVLQSFWHISMVAARVSAFVAFASVYHEWIFFIFGLHWMMMTIWIVLQKTDFCPSRLEEVLFNFVVGFVYCFCFFSLKEGPTRWRLGIFYSIMFVENAVLVGLWLPHLTYLRYQDYILLSAVFLGFFFGLCCLLLYYRFCHPSSPIYCCHLKSSTITDPDHKIPEDGIPDPQYRRTLSHKFSAINLQEVPQALAPTSSASALPQRVMPPSLSAAVLPRRTLLKSTSTSHAPVVYKPVESPSQLPPIPSESGRVRTLRKDGTFGWDAGSGFQHYSINASLCFYASKCGTIDTSGVELSKASLSPASNRRVSRELRFNDADVVLDVSNHNEAEQIFAKASRHGSRYGYVGYNDVSAPDSIESEKVDGRNDLPPPDIVTDSLMNASNNGLDSAVNHGQSDPATFTFSDVSPFVGNPTTPHYMSTPANYLKAGPRPLVMVTPIRSYSPVRRNKVLNYSDEELNRSCYDNLIPTQSQDNSYYCQVTPCKQKTVESENVKDARNDTNVLDQVSNRLSQQDHGPSQEARSSQGVPQLDAHSLALGRPIHTSSPSRPSLALSLSRQPTSKTPSHPCHLGNQNAVF